MPEGRDSEIMVRLEPTFRSLVAKIERDTGMSASSYVRGCILRDLYKRGVLSQELLVRTASMSTKELTDFTKSAAASAAGGAL